MIKGYNPNSEHIYKERKRKESINGVKGVLSFLPGFNIYNLIKESDKIKKTVEPELGFFLNLVGRSSLAMIYGLWATLSLIYNTANPKEWKAETEVKVQYNKSINNSYNKLFENAANFEDSLKIYQENNLPTKLVEPSLENKERIVKSLEKEVQ